MPTAAPPKPKKKRTAKTAAKPSANGKHAPAAEDTKYPPAVYAKVHELEKCMAEGSETEVRSMITVGREVQTIVEDTATYGGIKYKELVKLFKTGRSTLQPSYALACRYTDDEIDHLLGERNEETGAGLHRAHLAALSRVEDKGEAMRLAKLTVAEGWTKNQLIRQVIIGSGGTRSQGGRKRRALKSLREFLVQYKEFCENFIQQDLKVWRVGGSLQKLLDAALTKSDKADIIAVGEALKGHDDLAAKMDSMLPDLKMIKRKLTA